MRYRTMLPAAAGILAVVHVVGIFVDEPLLPQAEMLALLLLAAYALSAGYTPVIPAPPAVSSTPDLAVPVVRWVVPVALTTLMVDAWHSMPIADARRLAFLAVDPPDPALVVTAEVRENWAGMVFVSMLALTARLGGGRPGRPATVGMVLAAVLVTGYAFVRSVAEYTEVWELRRQHPGVDGDSLARIAATGVAGLLPLALALGAIVLVALLLAHRLRLAAGGAVLLVLVALIRVDAVIGSPPQPPHLIDRGGVFTAATQTVPGFAAHGPAMVAALELAAYLLLVVGLYAGRTGRSPAPDRPEPVGT
ncbi:hypothetical protein HCA58_13360 [Micromonospora sp. HNM0581]|uniref:hypothetical protein n=1 Tax=Micromonospora sp. HNM0581 TaxID=2716341 RepID=UPI00146F7894|nr:hypothetical protein [Micromonospora sp. HNM0581]NLU79351.1 hypothetical protein [Micromonospora sp. HNM0581]